MSSSPTHAFALIKDRGLVRVEGRVLVRVEGRVFVRLEGPPRQAQCAQISRCVAFFSLVDCVTDPCFSGSFLPEDNDHRIMRSKCKRREGKVTQVYRKKWVINRLLASITRRSPAAAKHYAAKVARGARIKS